ncbi:MAG: RIP metalloprotease RseP [Desulfovibrio sp.]|nr:RIP metalloprotease RseP [Desulfovibrio sp.]
MESVVSVALVLGGLIFFHELGHFAVARLFGIGVVTFSLGFGPKLFGFTRGATRYVLSAIPLGGYVQLAAQDPGDEAPEGFDPKTFFRLRPAWQRMLVVAAGPGFNFILAWLIFWVLFFAHGRMEVLPVIGQVQKDSPAEVAGILPGDRVVSIDGVEVRRWDELAGTVRQSGERPVTLLIDRDGGRVSVTLTPEIRVAKNIFGEEERVPLLGIVSAGKTVTVPLTVTSSAGEALARTWEVVSMTLMGMLKLVQRAVPLDNLGGPIMIAQMVSQQAAEGLANVLALAAVISINLGILNLLPIPVLDGGHILFFTLETILRRPVSLRWQQITTRVGLAFLIGLMALALYNDLQRIFV